MNWRSWLEQSPFLKANLLMGASSFVRLVAGLVKTKVSALLLGTVGVGVLGIGSQIQLLGLTWGSLSLGAGFTQKYSAAVASGDLAERKRLLSTTFTVLALFNLMLVGLSLIFSPWLGSIVLGADSLVFLPILLAIPFHVMVGAYFMGVLYAHGKYDLWARVSAISAVPELALFCLGAWYFGTIGAMAGLAAGMMIWALLLLKHCLVVERAADLFRFGFHPGVVKGLASSSLVMSLTSTGVYFSALLIRMLLVKQVSPEANGAYQAACIISGLYIPFVTNGIWAHLFPKVSAATNQEDVGRAFVDSLRVTAALAAVCQVGLLLLPNLFISLAFSRGFTGVMDFLPLQLFGDFFFLIAQPGLAIMLARGRLKSYAATWCAYCVSLVVLPWLLVPNFGGQAVSIGYVAGNFALAGVSLSGFFSRRLAGTMRLFSLLGVLGVFVGISSFFADSNSDIVGLGWRVVSSLVVLVISLSVLAFGAQWKVKIFNAGRHALLLLRMEKLLVAASLSSRKPRWISKILPNHYQYPRKSYRSVERSGIRYELDIGDFLDWHIYFGQMEGSKDRLYALPKAGDVVIDVGANIGETALTMAATVGKSGKVFAFEPDPRIRARCERNFELNSFSNLDLVPYALSDAPAKHQLFCMSERNPAGNRILAEGSGDSVSIESIRLDDFLADKKVSVSLIKIDVEGFEYNVIRGAEATIRRDRPVLFIELSDSNLRANGITAVMLLELVESFGYQITRADTGGVVEKGPGLAKAHFDVICVPN